MLDLIWREINNMSNGAVFRNISISNTAVTFQLTGVVAITGAITVRAAAEGRWSDMT